MKFSCLSVSLSCILCRILTKKDTSCATPSSTVLISLLSHNQKHGASPWPILQGQEQWSIHVTLKVLNFWKFTCYCSLKPLWSGMGEVVPARTLPTLHPPSPPSWPSIVATCTVRLNIPLFILEGGVAMCALWLINCSHNPCRKIKMAICNLQTECPCV